MPTEAPLCLNCSPFAKDKTPKSPLPRLNLKTNGHSLDRYAKIGYQRRFASRKMKLRLVSFPVGLQAVL